ncbi:MAG: hypothetical protein ACLQU3_29480 [Limisphaerales bacterium]
MGTEKRAELESVFRRTFACLIGLISAVEKETGKLGKAIAVITSAVVLGLARILPASFGPRVPESLSAFLLFSER